MSYYKLDPVHYFGTLEIAWDACLKMSGQWLELLTNPEKHLFVERAQRGEMSFIGQRCSEANDKYMENYDETKESTYFMYFDANSLYNWTICNDLPVRDFKWVKTDDKNEFINKKISEKNYNFFVECDITYPQELHDLHNDYPLAPDRMVIDKKLKNQHTKII